MIKIKDNIINENEIVYIEEFDAQSLGIMFKGKDKATFVDAHIEDIEWNYDKEIIRKALDNDIDLRIKIQELEEENERLKAEVDLLNDNRHYLNNKIDKAIEYINKFESIRAYFEYTDEDGYDEYDYDDNFRTDLFKILKGGENSD